MTTEMIYGSSCRESWLKEFLLPMYKHGDMIVGLDTEWSLKHSPDTGTNETRIVLLKLCNQACCLLIKLDMSPPSIIEELSRLLVNKDLLFAGININKDLELLRKGYGLEIKSYLELSELASSVVHVLPQPQPQPHVVHQALNHCTYSIRGLASEILSQPLKPRPMSVAEADWSGSSLTVEQIEYATGDAYFTYKIAQKLLINIGLKY